MSVRSVIVRLEAEVAGYVAGMGRAGRATDDVARQVVQARRSIDQNQKAMDTAGTSLLAFGTISVAALGASAKAAMDWESAWAGVTKTVDGSPEQMDQLESSLRGLAKTLPATHAEIAGVAEAAGQLGVAREDVTAFTKTMIDLANTTNLTADEAATSIAQFMNVMGTAGDDVDNLGAALVALGNDGASTEKQIIFMAQRISGAGKLVGASESDVLALANALASVGIEAELGGGVTSRVLQRMYADVKTGGEGLEALAKLAGTSGKDFAAAFENDPVRAMDAVIKGLSRVKDEGGNVVEAMKEVGIKGTEETGVILRLAGAGNLLADSLDLGSKAWKQNTALVNEANKRYETTESKIKIAWNGIKDSAIDAGAVMLPILQGVAESVSGLTQAFGDLPEPVQNAVTVFVGIAGVTALAAGGLLKVLPALAETRAAFTTLNTAGSRIPGLLSGIGKAAGAAAGAFVAFEVIKGIHNSMEPATASLEEFTQALVTLSTKRTAVDDMFKNIGAAEFEGEISSAGEALNKLVNQDFNSAVESFGASIGIDNGMAKLADGIEKADKAIASAVVSGNTEMAAKGFKSIAESAKEQGISLEEVGKRFPQYLDSLRKLANDAGKSVTEQELLNWAMGETPAAMKEAAEGGDKAAAGIKAAGEASAVAAAQAEEIEKALDDVGLSAEGAVTDIGKFTATLFNAGLISLSASDAAIGYQDAIDKMTESVTKNGTTLDLNTEAGRANQSAYNGLARAAMATAEAAATETLATQGSAAAQAELQGKLRTSYDDLVAAAGQFGIVGDEADTMARKALGVPKNVNIDAWIADHASQTLEGIKGKADNLDGRQVNITIRETTFLDTVRSDTVVNKAGNTNSSISQAYASGGEIDGNGPKGIDSELILAAPGEHMLTAREVDMMGGQNAVYRFRAQLRAGAVPAYANGGGIGAVASPSQFMNHYAQPVATAAAAAAPNVAVYIGNEQINARIVNLAAGVVANADGKSRYTRAGR